MLNNKIIKIIKIVTNHRKSLLDRTGIDVVVRKLCTSLKKKFGRLKIKEETVRLVGKGPLWGFWRNQTENSYGTEPKRELFLM